MAPNVNTVSGGEVEGTAADADPLRAEANKKERKEIFYNGYFYDVTQFISRHPGGSLINFYTEKGEDATQAIEQFHFRSKSRVEAIMRTLKRRPAEEPQERGMNAAVLTRHEALSKDFNQLFQELVTEGYFTNSLSHVILRLFECIAPSVFFVGIFFICDTFWNKFLSVIFIGVAYSRFGWLQHEAGHRSLTGNRKLDEFLQTLANGLPFGSSASWWNSQHNRHHSMPQRVNHDVDLATLPFVAFHEKTVKDKKQINKFFVRYQGVFYWTVDLFLVIILWRLVLHPRHQLKKKAYFDFFTTTVSGILSLNLFGIFWYFMILYWVTFFLGINFALSHSHLEVTEKPTHWVEYSLTHTANITPSIWVDYWMGYLNYQIEHHLFPTMPQYRQKEITHRVRALAEKHGLPYRVYSYPEACRLAFKNLNDVGMKLTEH